MHRVGWIYPISDELRILDIASPVLWVRSSDGHKSFLLQIRMCLWLKSQNVAMRLKVWMLFQALQVACVKLAAWCEKCCKLTKSPLFESDHVCWHCFLTGNGGGGYVCRCFGIFWNEWFHICWKRHGEEERAVFLLSISVQNLGLKLTVNCSYHCYFKLNIIHTASFRNEKKKWKNDN